MFLPVLEFAAGYVATKVLDEVYQNVRDRLVEDFHLLSKPLESSLESLNWKVDQLLAVPLRAGITFASLGKHQRALEELVRAEAADPSAPVAKFLLGALLAATGEEARGREFLDQALASNPYLATPFIAGTTLGRVVLDRPQGAAQFSFELPSQESRSAGPFPPSRNVQGRSATIQTAGGGAGKAALILTWLDWHSARQPETVVTAIDPGRSAFVWHHRGKGFARTTCLPGVVAIHWKDNTVDLVDRTTGTLLRNVSWATFSLLYLGWADVDFIQSQLGLRAADFETPEQSVQLFLGMEHAAKQNLKAEPLLTRLSSAGSDFGDSLIERGQVGVAIGDRYHVVDLTNTYKYVNEGHATGMGVVSIRSLRSTARVTCWPASA